MESKPLSPHLQIYRPQLTSVLSISHRASGIFLGTAGLLALVVWLGSIALGPSQYEMTMSFLRHPLMLPVLLLLGQKPISVGPHHSHHVMLPR